MDTINNSYSIPNEEFEQLKKVLDDCEKLIERPNMTEIIRVGISVIVNEKKPKDISQILAKIGRRKPGRPQKDKEVEIAAVDEIDFSQISDSQWEKIKFLFLNQEEARTILSEILSGFQTAYQRGVNKNYVIYNSKRWRVLQQWQEEGKWKQVYHLLLPTFDKKHRQKWDKIFLYSYLSKRKRRMAKKKDAIA
jgi:hypothetical protein